MLQKSNLEQVFERPFKDDGENYVGLCPVHEEKTPSFYVHKEDYIVHCFGCGAKGTLINFTKRYKGVEEGEAYQILGLTLEDEMESWFNAVLPPKTDPHIYPESWLAPFRKEVSKYVLRRGFTVGTIRAAEGLFDAHQKRQVFPHRDRHGRLLGAIGRQCGPGNPKWWFYWGFEKGRACYRGPSTGDQGRPTWVVEGVFDALWLYQHGINAVATLGSKPTDSQINELKEFDELVIAYDNDEAGLRGARHLYTRLKNVVPLLSPIWPRWEMDVMDINPHDLRLVNLVQWELIPASDRSSRVPS